MWLSDGLHIYKQDSTESCSRRFLTCASVARLELKATVIVTDRIYDEQNDIIEDAGLKFYLVLYLL